MKDFKINYKKLNSIIKVVAIVIGVIVVAALIVLINK